MADTSDDLPVPASPPSAVLDAFREQLTPEFLRRARRYARKRAKLVREVGRRNDPQHHEDLVQQALSDTWSGVAGWEPSETPLLDHVRDLIKQRTYNERRSLKVRTYVSLHAPMRAANDEVSGTLLTIEEQLTEAHVARRGINRVLLTDVFDRVLTELHRLAARDEKARAILGCWASGISEPADVMTLTGLSDAEFGRARKRILYLARHLPPELRDAAEELLRSVS